MIGRTGAGRDAEQFAAWIDGRRTERDPSTGLGDLVGVVDLLRDVEPVSMQPQFATSLRAQLMLEAPERLAELAASSASDSGRSLHTTPSRRGRLTRIAAVTCLVVGVTGGVAAASQSALPGDPLYGVKRGIERAQVGLAWSDAAQGERLVDQASTRLDEIGDLALNRPDDPTTTRLIEQTLADFSTQATDGADALITSYENTSDESDISQLREFSYTSARDLDDLSAVVPTPARDDLLEAAQLLSALDQDARDTCADCSKLAPLEVSEIVQQLAATTQSLLDLPPSGIADNDPSPNNQQPSGDLPTIGQAPGVVPSLPALTQAPSQDGKPGTRLPTISTPSPGGGGQQGTTRAPVLPELPLPSLPLPSLPLLDDLLGDDLLGGGQQ